MAPPFFCSIRNGERTMDGKMPGNGLDLLAETVRKWALSLHCTLNQPGV